MSGLELAAGVIAVVQATGQAASLTLKLKRLWGDVKDAPDDIQDLLDDIEATGLVLQDIEDQLRSSAAPAGACSPPHLHAVLQRSQLALKPLDEAVNILQRELDRHESKVLRRISSAKIVLKRPVLDRLEAKLRRALALLQLSANVHVM